MLRRMLRQEQGVQPIGGVHPGMTGAELADFQPAPGIDGRNDQRVDAALAGAFDDRLEIASERLVVEMHVAVDERYPGSFFVHWQRVLRRWREDNVTSVS
ncbi:hypothetical protein UUC_04721 [Rhodanobacter denitrificans]|nr:hypothetical protein UUC_04721 [Rhodanobacter denitrificans]